MVLRVLVLLAALVGAASVRSESTGHEPHDEHGVDTHPGAYHKNVIGLFTGLTHKHRGTNEFAVGLEYERRLTERFGVGGLVEYTGGDADVWIYAVPFAFHFGHWKFLLAPGIEDGHHGSEELVRLGAEYAFELSGGWEIAPQVNVDFVDSEDVWVLGVVFARGF